MSFGYSNHFRTVLSISLISVFSLLVTGCALGPMVTDPDTPIVGPSLQGKSYGGETPISGQKIYLLAATVYGTGSGGYGLASTSLLDPLATGHAADSIGSYVLTDANGNFALNSAGPTYFYTCPSAATQVYLYGLGGNTGSGTNAGASLMAALGSCGNLSSSTYVTMNELTTVATAYALSGFATDSTHVSIPLNSVGLTYDSLAATDLQNAFANVNNLVNIATGAARTITPGGNGTPDTAQIITLGNILAACVSSYPTNSPANCNTLFTNAGSNGGGTGTIPTDTATAAINIAHNPYVNSTVMSNLYGLVQSTGAPFPNGASSQPNDFTVGISFTGGGLSSPYSIAIDGSGNAWVANYGSNSLSKFASSGTAISSSTGYTGGGLSSPYSIAIDGSGNVWAANSGNNSVSKFASTGTATSTSSGYTGGGLSNPCSIAIDSSGNAWVSNYGTSDISKFSSTGTAMTLSTGYTGGGLNSSYGIAIDGSGNVWVANSGNNSVSKFASTGTAMSLSTGFTGGGLNSAYGIAIDGSGDIWVSDSGDGSLSEFSSTGAALSTTSGFIGGGLSTPKVIAADGSGKVWVADAGNNRVSEFSSTGAALSSSTGYTGGGVSVPNSLAIDGSGNVWISDSSNNKISELVGAATPIVTPVVANLITPYTAPASRP